MLRRYRPRDEAGFREALAARAQFGDDHRVTGAVEGLIADVRARGDLAVSEAVSRFDGARLSSDRFRVSDAEWDALAEKCPGEVRAALQLAAERIVAFHRAHKPQTTRVEGPGTVLEQRIVPLGSALCYAPGGRATYPSSVLMTAIPARVAGVKRVCVTSPAKGDQDVSPAIAAAARIAGADELWRLGGVQAVAAFALGTESIRRVDKIAGPGNAFVTEAKRRLSTDVGIDLLAGPTEVLVLAEEGVGDPRWIACDLIAQAEHDPEARSVLVTTSEALVDAVDRALAEEDMGEVAAASLRDHGCAVICESFDDAVAFAESYAPEHLELIVREPRSYVERLSSAGAIFVGPHAPVAVGDYLAGPNHTLPTAGTARFSSGLSTVDFVRRQSVIEWSRERLAEDTAALGNLARAEGLPAHARAAEVRRS